MQTRKHRIQTLRRHHNISIEAEQNFNNLSKQAKFFVYKMKIKKNFSDQNMVVGVQSLEYNLRRTRDRAQQSHTSSLWDGPFVTEGNG